MTDRPPAHPPPDPPGSESNTPSRSTSRTRSTTNRLPPSAFAITSSQTPDRPTVSGLAAYKKNRSRKRLAISSLNNRNRPDDQTLLGTPRSTRFKNIFTGSTPNPNLLGVTRKLHGIIEGSIILPKKGGEKISSLGAESAADIKILAATVLDLVEQSSNIPLLNRRLLATDDDDHQIKSALAGTNAFGCKIPDIIETRLDNIDKSLADIKQAFSTPNGAFHFTVPTKQKVTVPTYALAASKHAPHTDNLPAGTSQEATPATPLPDTLTERGQARTGRGRGH